MFKIEIRQDKFGVMVESDSISNEKTMRKLVDDITEKFNPGSCTKKLSE